jgi:hypothetical protein
MMVAAGIARPPTVGLAGMLRAWQRMDSSGPRGPPAGTQDELVEARNRLARAIAGAAMSGMTRDEIVEVTGYPADLVVRICSAPPPQRAQHAHHQPPGAAARGPFGG